jgi:hypothetical protein
MIIRIVQRTVLAIVLAGLCAGPIAAQDKPNSLSARELSDGFKLLFDGKTMNGWETHVANNWSVREGTLFCDGKAKGWLGTTAAYGDFILRLESRGSEKVNSGVYIRTSKEGGLGAAGYEVQIWDYSPSGFVTGSLVGSLKTPTPTKMLADQWNRFDITAQGDHYVVVMNGKTLVDGHDAKHVSPGVIGLQSNVDSPIEFRSIRIKMLGN